MGIVYLVRHAASSGQEPTAPLTDAGQAQALALAEFLQPLAIKRVLSSTYTRALQTIAPFAARAGLSVEPEPRLIEQPLSNQPLADWRDHLRRSFDDLDYVLEGGESSRAAQQRGLAVVDAALSGVGPVVLVTHGKLLATLLRSFDNTFGYDAWAALSNPDVYAVHPATSSQSARVEHLWRTRP